MTNANSTAEAVKFNAINSERFFQQISHFFERPEGVLLEIAQNAHRAGATKLDITLSDNALVAIDNGHGADSVVPLLCLSDSAWHKEVEEGQMPAGWGLFYLVAISERVSFRSNFGYIEVDCNKFLNVTGYREGLFGLMKPGDKAPGFMLKAVLKDEVAAKFAKSVQTYNLGFFPLDITFNRKPIERLSLSKMMENYGFITLPDFKPGCKVYLNSTHRGLFTDGKANYNKIGAVFHGIPINVSLSEYYNYFSEKLYIEVTEGCPITPVLPYRTTIKKDEKLAELVEYVRQYIVADAKEKIKNADVEQEIVEALHTLERAMTQEELDTMDIWYVNVTDLADTKWEDLETMVVKKGETVPSNKHVTLKINGEEVLTDFVVEEIGIKHVKSPLRVPRWLKSIPQEEVVASVSVASDEMSKQQTTSYNYTWCKAESITVGGKALTTLCTINDYREIDTIFYTNSPKDFLNIDDIVFRNWLFITDGYDGYDTQESDFRQNVSSDIQRLIGQYELSGLLKGLWVAGVVPYHVQEIHLSNNKMRIVMKDGTESLLNVA